MTTPQTRQSVIAYEQRFRDVVHGYVDLLALFDSLRPYPEQTALYIEASREMRAERQQTAAVIRTA